MILEPRLRLSWYEGDELGSSKVTDTVTLVPLFHESLLNL
jgi:hypothetical protein